jgi:hypothetical protein
MLINLCDLDYNLSFWVKSSAIVKFAVVMTVLCKPLITLSVN